MNDRRTDGRSAPDDDGLRADPRDRPGWRETPRRPRPLDRLNLADRLRRAEPVLSDDTPDPAAAPEIPWSAQRSDRPTPDAAVEPGEPARSPKPGRAEAPEPLISWPLRRSGPNEAPRERAEPRFAPDHPEPPERPEPPKRPEPSAQAGQQTESPKRGGFFGPDNSAPPSRREPEPPAKPRRPAEPEDRPAPNPRPAGERPPQAAADTPVPHRPAPEPEPRKRDAFVAEDRDPPRRREADPPAEPRRAAAPEGLRPVGLRSREDRPRPAAIETPSPRRPAPEPEPPKRDIPTAEDRDPPRRREAEPSVDTQRPAEPEGRWPTDPRLNEHRPRPVAAKAPVPPRPAPEPPKHRPSGAEDQDPPRRREAEPSAAPRRPAEPEGARPAAPRPSEERPRPAPEPEPSRQGFSTSKDSAPPRRPEVEPAAEPRRPAEPAPRKRGFFVAEESPPPRPREAEPAKSRGPAESDGFWPAGPRLPGEHTQPTAENARPPRPAREAAAPNRDGFAARYLGRWQRRAPEPERPAEPEWPAGPRLGEGHSAAAARRPAPEPEPEPATRGLFAADDRGTGRHEPRLGDGPRLAADRPRKGDGGPSRRSGSGGGWFARPARELSSGGNGGGGGGNGRRPAGRRGGPPGGGRGFGFHLVKWALVAAIWLIIAVGAVVGYYAWDLPDISQVAALKRRPAVTLVAADGSVFARYGDLQGTTIDAAKLPPIVVNAVLAVEDRHFFEHFGIDPLGLIRAALVDLRAGHVVQGGSTLTQQLAKNLFLTPDRTFKRKVQEALLAMWLEQRYTKDEILTAYLNRVYLGSGAYGIDAASRIYFDKPATQLNLHEAAVIAGLLKAPSRYSPLADLKAATQRADVVLDEMVAAGFITQQQAASAKKTPILPAGTPGTGDAARYFADWVVDQVNDYVGPDNQDLTVYTTLDPALERAAETNVANILSSSGDAVNASQAALVAMTDDGAVKAMVGGRDYRASEFNRATQALRQPGSSFKPFIYLTAMQEGLKPDSAVDAGPVDLNGWRPTNYEREFKNFHGSMTLADALAYSVNTATVRLLDRVGIDKVRNLAKTYGISTPLRRDLSLALGTSEVTLMDMTGAYAGFANGGHPVFPYAILRIAGSTGAVLYQRNAQPTAAAVDPISDAELVQMMTGVINRGTGTAARLGWPAAGKTGTTQDSRDAWFLGFTADLVTGVWMGNDDNSPMKRVVGGGLPAKLWHDFMTDAEAGKPPRPLPALAPAGLAPAGWGPTASGSAPSSPATSRPEASSNTGRPAQGGMTGSIADLIARITGQPATITQGRQNTNGH